MLHPGPMFCMEIGIQISCISQVEEVVNDEKLSSDNEKWAVSSSCLFPAMLIVGVFLFIYFKGVTVL